MSWTPCGGGFECARLRVPRDYDKPAGAEITVALIRLPAAAPGQRIGSLLINPGGPGGSGVDVVRGVGRFLPLELRRRFDIVGFDPRGIARSTPLRCYATFDEAINDLPTIAFPVTRKQENAWISSDRRLAAACRTHARAIIGHMSTADVARDMDTIRKAMGDARLNFLGFSYGSMLGQTYANLYPDKARALVIDGVLDPRAWVGRGPVGRMVPFGTRLRSAEGARRTLNEFFRLCDQAGRQCAFSGNSSERYAALARTLRAQPIDIDGFRFTYNDLIAISLGALYAAFIWPDFAAFLADIEREASRRQLAAGLSVLRDKLGIAAAEQEQYPNFVEGFPGVACSDANNPRQYSKYRRAADNAERDMGYFGRLWNWAGSVCAVWPRSAGQDRYVGPWTATTREPVLVVGNYFDPATRYRGAVAASQLLPNSRLLSYAGWGHTATFSGSPCVDGAVTRYLVTLQTPPEGTVCQPLGSPFGAPAARTVAAGASVAIADTLPPAVRRALAGR